MPARKGLLAPQNTFLDTIATRFDGTHSNFVLGNAKIAKIYPIVYCSDGFCDLSGYSRAHIMQKSCACNFLYGQKTDVQHREAISRALEQKQELKLEVILYKSSGTPFWCLLDIVPIQDEKHEVVLFLCSHKDITKQKLHEQQQHQLQCLKQQQLQLHASQSHHQVATDQSGAPHQAHQVGSSGGDQAGAESKALVLATDQKQQLGASQSQQQLSQEQDQRCLDEAQMSALANETALISMNEFGLLEDSGNENEGDDGDESEDQDKHTTSQYSRRRSRAVLYQLSGHYGYRRNVNMKSKLKLNNRMNIPEYKTTTIEKQRFILSHYGVGKSCWDWLILVVSFYVAIVVPYNATFNDKKLANSEICQIDFIDILVEVVFVIDVILNFRTTFVNRKGEVVTRPKIICKHYVRGWFLVDACAALPFDLLCSLNLHSRSLSKLNLDLNLLKLIRLLRLARLLQKMDRYSQYSYIILTLLMLIFSLLAHWCACIWYVIAMKEIDVSPRVGWIHQLGEKFNKTVNSTDTPNALDMASRYVTSLYFTTSSLTSVGFGNVSANTNTEKIFSIVIMLIGALMHAVVFGNVTALIRVMYARRSNYQTRLRDLKDFFRLHQLPKELQQRMSDYFQTTWSLNHGIETYEILKDFPEELRGDVSLHLHREVLSLPIFETAPQGFLKSLARHIESKFCCPTEYLIHRGDALSYLYLVCNGSMEVLQNNMVVAILGKGDLVGYDVNAVLTPEHTQYGLSGKAATLLATSMAGLVKSSSDLKALTYCDLKCIHIGGLLEVLKLYPEFSDTFHDEIIHDLSFNLRETHEEPGEPETDEEAGAQAGAAALGAPGEEEDDDDDDDEEDDHGQPRRPAANGKGGRRGSPPPPPPPPGMGQLYRSITGAPEEQIGRYDHDDDDDEDDDEEDDGEPREGEPLSDEEEDEEEEGEQVQEDDEEEDEDDDDGGQEDQADEGDERHSEEEDHDHGPSDGDDNGQSAPGEPDREPQQQHRHQGGASGDGGGDARHKLSEQPLPCAQNSARGAERSNELSGSLSDEVLEPAQSVANQVAAQDKRRQRETATSTSILHSRRGRQASLQDDWQSAHSYDGAIDACRPKKFNAASARGRFVKNHSDDISGAHIPSQFKRPRLAANSAPLMERQLNGAAGRQNLRSAIGQRQNLQGRERKPPLSFDLSRNTMAIVDRRRRSAGCIPRPLLLANGPGGSNASRRTGGHSSLTHINEDDAPASVKPLLPGCGSPGSSVASSGGSSSKAARSSGTNQQQQQRHRTRRASDTPHPNASGRGAGSEDADSFCSSQELKGIEARITGLSSCVREMKQELKRELGQFRGLVRLLMQVVAEGGQVGQVSSLAAATLANQQRARKTATAQVGLLSGAQSTGSLRSPCGALSGARATAAVAAPQRVERANALASGGRAPLMRSQSASENLAAPAATQLRRRFQRAAPNERQTSPPQQSQRPPNSAGYNNYRRLGGAETSGEPDNEQRCAALAGPPCLAETLECAAFIKGSGGQVADWAAGSLAAEGKRLTRGPPPPQQQQAAVGPCGEITGNASSSTSASGPQQLLLLAHSSLRPNSQNSASSGPSLRQYSSGANLNSDNDSGRSTSSVNSWANSHLRSSGGSSSAGNGADSTGTSSSAAATAQVGEMPVAARAPQRPMQLIVQTSAKAGSPANHQAFELSTCAQVAPAGGSAKGQPDTLPCRSGRAAKVIVAPGLEGAYSLDVANQVAELEAGQVLGTSSRKGASTGGAGGSIV